jgi:hypothetical protein
MHKLFVIGALLVSMQVTAGDQKNAGVKAEHKQQNHNQAPLPTPEYQETLKSALQLNPVSQCALIAHLVETACKEPHANKDGHHKHKQLSKDQYTLLLGAHHTLSGAVFKHDMDMLNQKPKIKKIRKHTPVKEPQHLQAWKERDEKAQSKTSPKAQWQAKTTPTHGRHIEVDCDESKNNDIQPTQSHTPSAKAKNLNQAKVETKQSPSKQGSVLLKKGYAHYKAEAPTNLLPNGYMGYTKETH